jgi:cytochrome c oxidase cbb3-type subunit I/II
MPSYRDPLSEEDRWALSYYVLALSAYKDPLSGEPLPIAPSDRRALNDPALEADTPDKAYIQSGRAAASRGGAHALTGKENSVAKQRAAKE